MLPPGRLKTGRAAVSFASNLTFEGVSHAYGRTKALCDVSLEVKPGEVMCLLGPSGCGKSTLLRIAAGVERPTHGRVLLGGAEMAGPSRFVPPEKRGVGLVFQDFALFPHLTVLKNVMFGLTRLGSTDAREVAAAALKRVGLDGYEASYPHMLSGGQQQRVALARAMAPRPAVLLMDEPFSGLDTRLRDQVRDDTMAVLREAMITCIFVTHDPEEAMRVADRIALLRHGRLVQIGTPDEIYNHPVDLEAARFFCEINEVPGIMKAGEVTTLLGAHGLADTPDNAAISVCFRPQAATLCADGEGGTPGRIVARQFLGEDELLDIEIDGLESPIRVRTSARTDPARTRVCVRVSGDGIMVFPSIT